MWNKRLEFWFDSLDFYFFCDVGVKYLKWAKLGELVAKILINCFEAVKLTEILTQQQLGANSVCKV